MKTRPEMGQDLPKALLGLTGLQLSLSCPHPILQRILLALPSESIQTLICLSTLIDSPPLRPPARTFRLAPSVYPTLSDYQPGSPGDPVET